MGGTSGRRRLWPLTSPGRWFCRRGRGSSTSGSSPTRTRWRRCGPSATGEGVYQGRLRVPDSFYERFGIDPELLELRDCFPDLILAESSEGRTELRVVDVKASNWMKLSHRIQVGIYTLILEEVLRAEGIEPNMSRRGGVWLYGTPAAGVVRPGPHHPPDRDLPRRGPAQGAHRRQGRRLLAPQLPLRVVRVVHPLPGRGGHREQRVARPLPLLVRQAPPRRRRGGNRVRTWATPSPATVPKLWWRDAPRWRDGSRSCAARSRRSTPASPSRAGRRRCRCPWASRSGWFSPSSRSRSPARCTATPCAGSGGRSCSGATSSEHRPGGRPPRDDLDQLRRDLVGDLMAILGPIHDHNTSTEEWSEQISVQAYVFDTYERGMLTTVLLEATLDPAVSDDALALLFHFQRPELVEAEDHPDTEVFFPVIALNEVVRSLFALPIPVSYQLGPVSTALMPSNYGWEYRPFDFFTFRLSNRMKSNAIFEVWHRGRSDAPGRVDRARADLPGAGGVVGDRRDPGAARRHRAALRLAAQILPPRGDGVPPQAALPTRLHRPLRLGGVVHRAAHANVVFLSRSGSARRPPSGSPTWATTATGWTPTRSRPTSTPMTSSTGSSPATTRRGGAPGSPTTTSPTAGRCGRRSTSTWRWPRCGNAPAMSSASASSPGRSGPSPGVGDTLFLEPRYTDWLTEPLVGELAALDAEEDPWFVRLIEDPVTARSRIRVDGNERQRLLELGSRHSMTPSQLEAFGDVIDHDLQLVWGPPGTGKTHFLALAILCLAEERRRARRPFRVLVTAMTNTAIDNLPVQAGRAPGGEPSRRRGDRGGEAGGIASDEIRSVEPEGRHRLRRPASVGRDRRHGVAGPQDPARRAGLRPGGDRRGEPAQGGRLGHRHPPGRSRTGGW